MTKDRQDLLKIFLQNIKDSNEPFSFKIGEDRIFYEPSIQRILLFKNDDIEVVKVFDIEGIIEYIKQQIEDEENKV